MRIVINCLIIFMFFLVSAFTHATAKQKLKISGAVEHELFFDLQQLGSLVTTQVHLNDITNDGQFRGVFTFRGVPLKVLLNLAVIPKKGEYFNKQVELAVLIRNAAGKQIVLSWGEVFYQNSGDYMIAISSKPVLPYKGPEHFKDPEEYEKMMQILARQIKFPKLIVAKDFYSDRCLEQVTEIEVFPFHPAASKNIGKSLQSDNFFIRGDTEKELLFKALPDYRRVEYMVHVVGEGRGYHGTERFSGISLKQLIEQVKPVMDLNTVFWISASDGYHVLLSYGEIYLNPQGGKIIIADRINRAAIKNGGKFMLVLPGDLMADREVKSLSGIEIVSLKK